MADADKLKLIDRQESLFRRPTLAKLQGISIGTCNYEISLEIFQLNFILLIQRENKLLLQDNCQIYLNL